MANTNFMQEMVKQLKDKGLITSKNTTTKVDNNTTMLAKGNEPKANTAKTINNDFTSTQEYTPITEEAKKELVNSFNNTQKYVENVKANKKAKQAEETAVVNKDLETNANEIAKKYNGDFSSFYNTDGSLYDFGKDSDNALAQIQINNEKIQNGGLNVEDVNALMLDNVELSKAYSEAQTKKKEQGILNDYAYSKYIQSGEADQKEVDSYNEMASYKANSEDTTGEKIEKYFGRKGNALEATAVGIANEIPQLATNVEYYGNKIYADLLEDDAQLGLENGRFDKSQYDDLMSKVEELRAYNVFEDETKLSYKLNELATQYNSNAYFGAGEIETMMTQAEQSSVDFLAHYALGLGVANVAGALGTTKNIAELAGTISNATMATKSATQRTMELLTAVDENGNRLYSDGQALMNGLLTGTTSYVVEKVGMDNFVSAFTGGDHFADAINHWASYAIGNTAKQALAEGLEEVVEGVIDPALDVLTGVATNYEVNGSEILNSFIVGALAGAGSGASASLHFTVNTRAQYETCGAELKKVNELYSKYIEQGDAKGAQLAEMTALKIKDAMNVYEAKSTTLGVAFADEGVNTTSVEQDTYNMYKAFEPNFNEEVQAYRELNDSYNNTLNKVNEYMSSYGINADTQDFVDATMEERNNILENTQYTKDKNVKFVKQAKGVDAQGNVIDVDGIYNKKTNQIDISYKAKRGMVSTLVHEYTHLAENSKHYKTLETTVKNNIGEDIFNSEVTGYLLLDKGIDPKTATKNQINIVMKNATAEDISNAQREVVAYNVQDLLGNEEFAKRLVKYNESLVYRLLKDIKQIGSKGQDVSDIEYALMKALQDKQIDNYTKGERVEYSTGLNTKDIKKLSPKSFDKSGKLKSVYQQINEMKSDPSTFGFGTIDVGKSLNFVGVNDGNIFFSNKDLNHIEKHLDITEIANVLEGIKESAVIGFDYIDVRNPGVIKKAVYLDTPSGIYKMGLYNVPKNGIQIEEIKTLFDENNFVDFYNKAIAQGNKIYKNEKSDSFLSRFTLSRGSVNNDNTATNNISKDEDVVNSLNKMIGEYNNGEENSYDIIKTALENNKELVYVPTDSNGETIKGIYSRAEHFLGILPINSYKTSGDEKQGKYRVEHFKKNPDNTWGKFVEVDGYFVDTIDDAFKTFERIRNNHLGKNVSRGYFVDINDIQNQYSKGINKADELKTDVPNFNEELFVSPEDVKNYETIKGGKIDATSGYKYLDSNGNLDYDRVFKNAKSKYKKYANKKNNQNEEVTLDTILEKTMNGDNRKGETIHTFEKEAERGDKLARKIDRQVKNGANLDEIINGLDFQKLGTIQTGRIVNYLAYQNRGDLVRKVARQLRTDISLAGKNLNEAKAFKSVKDKLTRAMMVENMETSLLEEAKYKYKGNKLTKANETITNTIADNYDALISENNPLKFEKAFKDVKALINSDMPQTVAGILDRIRNFSMLSGTKTIIFNNVGNLTNRALNEADDFVRVFTEKAMNVPQNERTAILFSQLDAEKSKYNKEYANKLFDDLNSKDSKFSVRGDTFLENAQQNALSDLPWEKGYFIEQIDKIAQARGLDLKTLDLNSEAFADLFRTAKKKAEEVVSHNDTALNTTLGNISKRSAKNVYVQDNILGSVDTAIKYIKTQANSGNVLAKSGDAVARFLKKAYLPFVRTNASVATNVFEHSAPGVAKTILDYKKVKTGEMSTREYANNLAKSITGTGLFTIAIALTMAGKLRWDKEDEDYSGRLVIQGDEKGYTVDAFDPISSIFARGVAVAQELMQNGLTYESIKNIVADEEDLIINDNLDMFGNLIQLSEDIQNAKNGKNEYGDYDYKDLGADVLYIATNQFIPSILRDIARFMEPAQKITSSEDPMEYVVNRLINNTPFRGILEDKTNAQGDTKEYTEPFTKNDLLDRLITNFISRGHLVDEKGNKIVTTERNENNNLSEENSDLYNELSRLNEFVDDNKDGYSDKHWLRSSTPSTLYFGEDNSVKLSADDKAKYGTEWSSIWTSTADGIMSSEAYKGLEDNNKVDLLYKAQSYATGYEGYKYAIDNDIEPTEYQTKCKSIIDYCTTDGKLDGEKLALITKYTAVDDNGYKIFRSVDENGNTVKNSSATFAKEEYIKAGIYEDLIKFIEDNGLEYSDFGLTKTVVNKKTTENNTDRYSNAYSKVLGSNKTSLETNSSKKTNTISNSKSTSTGSKNASNASLYNKDTFASSYSKAMSKDSNTVTCPKCGKNVTPVNGKCPVCGYNL